MPEDLFHQEGAIPENIQGPLTPFTSLPIDVQNSAAKAADDWKKADWEYYASREPGIGQILGMALALGGGIFAPFFAPALGSALGISTPLATALIGGGSNAFGGILGGEDLGKALEGGLLTGGTSFLGSELGNLLHGGAGGLFGGGGGGLNVQTDAFNGLSGAFSPENLAGANFGNLTGADLTGLVSGAFGGAPSAAGGVGGAGPAGSNPFGGSPAPTNADPSVSELVVTGAPNTLPGLIPPNLPNINTADLTHPPDTTFANNNDKPDAGKPDLNKLINDVMGLLSGGSTGVVSATHALGGGGGGGVGPGGGGTGGTPPNPGGGLPGLPNVANGGGNPQQTFGLGGAPSLINASPTGGSGVGVGGAGNLDLKGSLAPDIYPWSTGGGL